MHTAGRASQPWPAPRTIQAASPFSSPRTASTSSCSTPPRRATPTCCQSRASKGQTMNTTRELRTHPRERTGVRFVLTNATDPSRADDYSAWYDSYENAVIRPGLIANAFRFENPNAAGTPADPRYAAIYDIVSPEPASAWPQTENSPGYPRYLFDDPRSRLVAPALRASYALTASLEAHSDHGDLTGVHIILSDGGTDAVREQRAAALLGTGFFYGASRSRVIEGSPAPPAWLEVFETDQEDSLTAYARARDALESEPPADGVRQRSSRP